MRKILVTGGEGRFATELKKIKTNINFFYLKKKQLDILDYKSLIKAIKKYKPDSILHLAGLSRPMSLHDKNVVKSINLNIVGTANVVKACVTSKIKIIYFSTSYIYQGKKGNYKESDPLLPWSNYGWSKLGGESAVQMYKNSLILRVCMTERPFVHDKAYSNVKSNFIFQDDLAKKFIQIINKRGSFNIGGISQTIYSFVKKHNKKIKKIKSNGDFPLKQDMSLKKINRALK